MSIALSEQEILRRDKLNQLRALGINPYPPEEVKVTATAQDILENFEKSPEKYKQVTIAGRVMSVNVMGSASFAKLQDSTGRIQIYLKRDDICPGEDKTLYNTVFKKLLDLGDYIGVKGYVFTTQTGEVSVHVQELVLLAKSLKPLPVVKRDEDGNIHDGFTDPEMRYRQRYVDLTVNPEYKQIFMKRSKVISAMREYFNAQGWMEVEPPILQPVHGGAAAR